MLSFYDYSTTVTPVINPLAIVMLASYPLVANIVRHRIHPIG